MNATTRAVANAYVAVLRRRSKRGWIPVPGPGDRVDPVIEETVRGIAPKEDEDAIRGGRLGTP